MASWNPPPPGDAASDLETNDDLPLEENSDAIGETVFSKSWVLSLLVKAVSIVAEEGGGSHKLAPSGTFAEQCKDSPQSGRESTENEGEVKKEDEQDEEKEKDDVMELDEQVENDLCQLWDASMNEEVAVFLHQNNAVPLLIGVLCQSKFPRLTEIVMGILGNLACVTEISLSLSTTETIEVLLMFLGNGDSKVLLELSRLMVTCLSHDQVRQSWISAISNTPSVCRDVCFILNSSTSEELLRSVTTLVDHCLDLDAQLLSEWSCRELVESLCEAAQQTRVTAFDVTSTIMLTLQLFTTVDEGIAQLLDREDEVVNVLCGFLKVVCKFEELSVSVVLALTASLTICDCLLSESQTETLALALKDSEIFTFLENLQKRDFLEAKLGGVVATRDQSGHVDSGFDDSQGRARQLSKLAGNLLTLLGNCTQKPKKC